MGELTPSPEIFGTYSAECGKSLWESSSGVLYKFRKRKREVWNSLCCEIEYNFWGKFLFRSATLSRKNSFSAIKPGYKSIIFCMSNGPWLSNSFFEIDHFNEFSLKLTSCNSSATDLFYFYQYISLVGIVHDNEHTCMSTARRIVAMGSFPCIVLTNTLPFILALDCSIVHVFCGGQEGQYRRFGGHLKTAL